MDRQFCITFLKGIISLFLIGLTTISLSTHAYSLKVRVLDADKSRPLKNIAVCLGTPGNNQQFGAVRTDRHGNATFSDLPDTEMLITVSAQQYKGIKRIVATTAADFTRIIHLPKGGLGPVCNAPPKIIEIKDVTPKGPVLKVDGIKIDRGHMTTSSRSVVLIPRIQGEPTHYRVSEDPQFRDAKWVAFQKTPLFTLSAGDGPKRIYFQVKKVVVMDDKATIEKLSNVASDRIDLRSRKISSLVLVE